MNLLNEIRKSLIKNGWTYSVKGKKSLLKKNNVGVRVYALVVAMDEEEVVYDYDVVTIRKTVERESEDFFD